MSRSAVDWRASQKINYINFKKKHPEVDVTFDEWKNVIYSFMELFKDDSTKNEFVTTFMAMLELLKVKFAKVTQDKAFSDIYIYRV